MCVSILHIIDILKMYIDLDFVQKIVASILNYNSLKNANNRFCRTAVFCCYQP